MISYNVRTVNACAYATWSSVIGLSVILFLFVVSKMGPLSKVKSDSILG